MLLFYRSRSRSRCHRYRRCLSTLLSFQSVRMYCVVFGERRERAWVWVCQIHITWHRLFSSFALLKKQALYTRRCLRELSTFINFALKWTWLRRNLIALFSKAHWAVIQGWICFHCVMDYLWTFRRLSFLVYRTVSLTKDSQVFMSCFIRGFSFRK